jgi:hypothetical protein
MTENTTKKHPTHTIYKVMGDGPDKDWIKVGVGFTHGDGKGIHLIFDGIPVEGHIAVRENRKWQPKPGDLAQETLPLEASTTPKIAEAA